jgi:hypothetical protein
VEVKRLEERDVFGANLLRKSVKFLAEEDEVEESGRMCRDEWPLCLWT